MNLLNIKVQPKEETNKDSFTVNAKADEYLTASPQKEEITGEVVDDPNLNISHIDKDKTAAPEYKHEDIHTN